MPESSSTLYGVRVASALPIPCSHSRWAGLGDVEIAQAPAPCDRRDLHVTSRLERPGFERLELTDGAFLVRWEGVGEFLISGSGDRVTFDRLGAATDDDLAFQLAGPVLSFALINLGADSLHASCVEFDGRAIAFLADEGVGKSTLAATGVSAGGLLVTDDVLVTGLVDGRAIHAIPGPAHLKIGAEAHRLLVPTLDGDPMADGERLLIRLPVSRTASRPVELAHLFVVERAGSGDETAIEPLSRREAFMECVRNTFNSSVSRRSRLTRHFQSIADMVETVPVSRLSVPGGIERLPRVLDAVRGHVDTHAVER